MFGPNSTVKKIYQVGKYRCINNKKKKTTNNRYHMWENNILSSIFTLVLSPFFGPIYIIANE